MNDLLGIKKGTLLIASPQIEDPFFAKSVIALCEHSPQGSFGLIINKPIETDLPDELFDTQMLINPEIKMLLSGPNQTNQLMLLHGSKKEENTLEICPDVYLGGNLEFLQSEADKSSGSPILLCFGYTGWGPRELERDLENGLWFTIEGHKEHFFESSPSSLWKELLRKKGGKYALLANIPDDLSLN